jgi:hypothetical protein
MILARFIEIHTSSILVKGGYKVIKQATSTKRKVLQNCKTPKLFGLAKLQE